MDCLQVLAMLHLIPADNSCREILYATVAKCCASILSITDEVNQVERYMAHKILRSLELYLSSHDEAHMHNKANFHDVSSWIYNYVNHSLRVASFTGAKDEEAKDAIQKRLIGKLKTSLLYQKQCLQRGFPNSCLPFLKQIANRSSLHGSCTICMEDFTDDKKPVTKLPCSTIGHNYHTECINNWFKNNRRCPICQDDSFNSLRNRCKDEVEPFLLDTKMPPTLLIDKDVLKLSWCTVINPD